MNGMTQHKEWIENRLGKTIHAVALELQEDPSNFSKKVRRGLTTDHIIQIARAYDVPVIQALRDTGVIKDEDVEPESPERIAETISYLARKLAVQVHKPEPESNVHPFPTKNVGQDFYDAYPDQAVAYHDDEIGGTPDDFDS